MYILLTNTSTIISYNVIIMTFVTTSNFNSVDNIYVKHVNVRDPRMSTMTLQKNIVLA